MMLVINNEIRAPLFSIVDGVGFVDIGNVFRRVTDFSFGDLRRPPAWAFACARRGC